MVPVSFLYDDMCRNVSTTVPKTFLNSNKHFVTIQRKYKVQKYIQLTQIIFRKFKHRYIHMYMPINTYQNVANKILSLLKFIKTASMFCLANNKRISYYVKLNPIYSTFYWRGSMLENKFQICQVLLHFENSADRFYLLKRPVEFSINLQHKHFIRFLILYNLKEIENARSGLSRHFWKEI